MKKKSAIQTAAIRHITENSSLYLFITVLFMMGVIFGAILVNSLSFTQKEDLFSYLNQFFGLAGEGNMAGSRELFLQSLSHNVKYIAVIWILGISIIGLPLILVLLFLKGVVVGFTVGFLVNQLGWHGFLLSFVSVLPQNMLIVPVFIMIAALALSLSMLMIRRIFLKQLREPLKPVIMRYLLSFAASLLFLAAAGMIEAYLSPPLMKSVAGMMGGQ